MYFKVFWSATASSLLVQVDYPGHPRLEYYRAVLSYQIAATPNRTVQLSSRYVA